MSTKVFLELYHSSEGKKIIRSDSKSSKNFSPSYKQALQAEEMEVK